MPHGPPASALLPTENDPILGVLSTVTEIEAALAKLSRPQQCEVAEWLATRLMPPETPAMLAALDVGIRSLEQDGAQEFSRADLEQKVRRWAGGSR